MTKPDSIAQEPFAVAGIAAGKSVWRRRISRLFRWGLISVTILIAIIYFVYARPFWGIPFNASRHGRVPLTPPWALECWLWEDDHNTESYLRELVDGYAAHDLPVGAVVIDSPWSERYNDFKFDQQRYPETRKFFDELHARGCRVVLWMTCMVNSRSKDTSVRASEDFFQEARTNHYLAGEGDQMDWWKGKGGFIDYSHTPAVEWWHGLQKQVLSFGADGWKLDGCDSLFSSRLGRIPFPFKRTATGLMSTRQYMDRYCREEYNHGLTQNSNFAILVRSMDHPWIHPEGFAPLDTATVTWVGDNRHTWDYKSHGLEAALSDILDSARLGYCVVGSDVGGYHGAKNKEDIRAASNSDSTREKELRKATDSTNAPIGRFSLNESSVSSDEIPAPLYIRWAEFSTFCGLFLNGGHGERRLWKRSAAELEIIRKFSWLHSELVPYMYSHVASCHLGGRPLMRPLKHGDSEYMFGGDFLVAPIHEDKLSRTISLPAGRWRYLFDDREALQGPVTISRDFAFDEFPVFIREGAIVPLNVRRPYTGFGDTNSTPFVTWLIYPNQTNEFTLFSPEDHPTPQKTILKVRTANNVSIGISGKHRPHILLVHADRKPHGIQLDGLELPEGDAWTFDSAKRRVTIKTQDYEIGRYEIFN